MNPLASKTCQVDIEDLDDLAKIRFYTESIDKMMEYTPKGSYQARFIDEMRTAKSYIVLSVLLCLGLCLAHLPYLSTTIPAGLITVESVGLGTILLIGGGSGFYYAYRAIKSADEYIDEIRTTTRINL